MAQIRSGQSIALLAILSAACPAHGDYTHFYDPAAWQDAVGRVVSLDFAEFAHATIITDQFSATGLLFTDGDDFVYHNPSLFPNDGIGLGGGASNINLSFLTPASWFAVEFPGVLRLRIFCDGELVFTELFGGGGPGYFAGIVAYGESFDRVELDDPLGSGGVFLDDLHFGSILPGDANLDGIVDINDLILVLLSWGGCKGMPICPADLTADGSVDIDDLLAVVLNWSS